MLHLLPFLPKSGLFPQAANLPKTLYGYFCVFGLKDGGSEVGTALGGSPEALGGGLGRSIVFFRCDPYEGR